MVKRLIYADNAATTGISDEVLKEMLPYFQDNFANASTAYEIGQQAKAAIERARNKVAASIKSKPEEIFFTSGGSEADNWAIRGVAEKLLPQGKKHIVTSVFEHHAVLHTCEALEKRGYEATYLPVDSKGFVNPEDVRKAIRDDTALVSIMYANNEIGTIQPIEQIAAICHAKGVLFHTDAVQAVGNVNIDVRKQEIDLLSISGHKIHAQKGIGVLYVKKGLVLSNLLYGGGQERGKRPGTENVPAIAGLGRAMELAVSNLENKINEVTEKRNRILDGILAIPGTRLNGDREKRLPGNSNISIEGIEGESLLLLLDQVGICASSGSACTSGSLEPSHVLLAIGLKPELAHGSIRLSISQETTDEEITYILDNLREIIHKLRTMSPLWEETDE
ncbi:cysteine desulfurase NifS [Aminipila butyrica]|uniref:Cysteine desulfurase IscS n=1 Tax=Aminipila butyrica TaxID=433296 RepID=A0A858BV75_9FIRM|nr:cysteine desulfurase NifS [Aminipila butyrica]QIB67966.1 cysteine desulfurase NifS [Aminipila butyrica]